jgi:hypothetical protein
MKNFLYLKTLTTLLSIFILVVVFENAAEAQFRYLGTYNGLGVPNYLEPVNDVVPTAFLDNIAASLPERYPVPTYHPQYITAGTETDISLTAEADVWVTFVSDGAGYRNVLGFYTYTGTAPTTRPADSNVTIIFPNVSASGSGGGLITGNKVRLGTFTAGTKIGWVLIANGYNGTTVTQGNWKLYSNPNYNPEADASLRYHNVLLNDAVYDKVVLGFEDIRRDNSGCDNDFNDAIFYISATPNTAINKSNLNTTTQTTPVGSGTGSGLESNGSLAEKISLRNIQNIIHIDSNKILPKYRYEKRAKGSSVLLSDFIVDDIDSGVTAIVSSPGDLIDITNAKEVFAIDYISNSQRIGAVLATKTENNVYEHTKSICDRLRGAAIVKIDSTQFENQKFITYTLLHQDNQIEYVTCFSLTKNINDDTLSIENKWLLSQFDKKDLFYNFQVWSSAPHITQRIIENIFAKARDISNINTSTSDFSLPSMYIKKGKYENQKLNIEITNPTLATEATIKLTYRKTEKSTDKEVATYPITINPMTSTIINLDIRDLFDCDIQLINAANKNEDMCYFADGTWGIEYENGVNINDFSINQKDIINSNSYSIDRDVKLNAITSEYINIYRTLRPANMPVDLGAYKNLSFLANGDEEIQITIVKKSISKWADQYRYSMHLPKDKKQIDIPLNLFKCNGNSISDLSDIQSIIFTIKGTSQEINAINLEIENVHFNNNNIVINDVKKGEIEIAPNPAIDNFDLMFNAINNGTGNIVIYSLNGEMVYNSTINYEIGYNKINVNDINKFSIGEYIIEFSSNDFRASKKISIIK